MVRRTLDGALKCALRDFLREEWRAGGLRRSVDLPTMAVEFVALICKSAL